MSTQRGLREDEVIVEGDLEATTARRQQREPSDRILVMVQELLRQTDGTGQVASTRTILDPDLHSRLPLIRFLDRC